MRQGGRATAESMAHRVMTDSGHDGCQTRPHRLNRLWVPSDRQCRNRKGQRCDRKGSLIYLRCRSASSASCRCTSRNLSPSAAAAAAATASACACASAAVAPVAGFSGGTGLACRNRHAYHSISYCRRHNGCKCWACMHPVGQLRSLLRLQKPVRLR
jgi:hypothetical protein